MRTESADPDEARFSRGSWIVLGFVILLLGLSLAETLYRLTLPWDGWSFTRDATGSGQRLVFDRSLTGLESPIKSGDLLISVDGQPFDEILVRALTLCPERPAGWEEGAQVNYRILRLGKELLIVVPLTRSTPAQVLAEMGKTWLVNPALLPALFIGLFVFLRRSQNQAARLLLVLCAAYFASNGISQAVGDSNIVGLAELFYGKAYWPAQFFNTLIWPFIIAPVYVHLFLIFPVPKTPILRYPRLTLLVLYGLTPVLTLMAAVVSYGDALSFWRTWAGFIQVDFYLTLTMAILCAGHTLATTRQAARRAQIEWVAWGTVITSIGSLSGGVLTGLGLFGQNWIVDLFGSRLLFLAFPLSVAIAILRYRLFAIQVIVRRTLIYGVLSSLLAALYFASVISLEAVFREITGHLQAELVTVISTLGIAALFVPLRQHVQREIDKRFYFRKYDATQTLVAFSETVRDDVDLDRLVASLLTVVNDTMQPVHVSLWLNEKEQGK